MLHLNCHVLIYTGLRPGSSERNSESAAQGSSRTFQLDTPEISPSLIVSVCNIRSRYPATCEIAALQHDSNETCYMPYILTIGEAYARAVFTYQSIYCNQIEYKKQRFRLWACSGNLFGIPYIEWRNDNASASSHIRPRFESQRSCDLSLESTRDYILPDIYVPVASRPEFQNPRVWDNSKLIQPSIESGILKRVSNVTVNENFRKRGMHN